MTGCVWRLTRGPPRDLDPSGDGEECGERGARAGRRKMPEAQERSRRDMFRVVRFAVLRAERVLVDRTVGVLCRFADVQGAREALTFEQAAGGSEGRVPEPLNAMTVQDSAVSKQKHLEVRMGSGTRIRATSVERNYPISSLGKPLARSK